jgi:hypothetical protein
MKADQGGIRQMDSGDGPMRGRDAAGIRLGLGLISAAMLVFEITLTRLFAIQQFHHFAFVVVSLAVMGIAAGGTLLALSNQNPPLGYLAAAFTACVGLAYAVINFLPFDSYTIAWDARQIGVLLLYLLATAAPFTFAGWTIGIGLAVAGERAHQPYAANLLGSAVGCVTALAALDAVGEVGALAIAMLLGLSSVLAFTRKREMRAISILTGLALLALTVATPQALALNLSPYKALSTMLLSPDATRTYSDSSASARLDVIESDTIHVFPGLSLNARGDLPPQAGAFIDGEGPIPITGLDPDSPQAERLAGRMPATLAYRLRPRADALILSPGAGLDALLALAADAARITMSVPEPLIPALLRGPYSDFSRDLLADERISLEPRGDRGLLSRPQGRYEIVQFVLSDPYRPVTSGAFSLSEDFTLTREAFRQALNKLEPQGVLVITRWLGTPPTESARAWATLLSALDEAGLDAVEGHLIAFRGMRTATMLASRRAFSDDELAATRAFLTENAFDPIYLPDIQPEEINRFNQLPEPVYHRLFRDLIDQRRAALHEYPFDLSPPTDQQPYFFHFFRWRQIPEVLATLGTTWQPFGGSGYLVILALLLGMVLIALPLILAPALNQRGVEGGVRRHWPALAYFGSLGAAYLLIEIPLIQHLTLLLDWPAWSLAAVLFTILLASGLGSLASPRVSLRPILLGLVGMTALTLLALPKLIEWALSWALPLRLLFVVGIISPLGFLMGIPFAAGLRHFRAGEHGLIPWAWAMNGAISGISGVLAAMASLQWGFDVTLLLGGLIYAGAWVFSGLGWEPGEL